VPKLPHRLPALLAVALASAGCGPGQGVLHVPAVEEHRSASPYRVCNVVLVNFDALQAAHVGCLGNARDVTPTLDGFARRAYRFRNAVAVASWTAPSTMTWFTGVYPSEHRMTNKFSVYNAQQQKPAKLKDLAPELVTLAEVLRADGYATGGFTGNAGVSGFGYDQGFDTYFFEPNRFGGFDRSVPKALDWLRAHKDRKFFLFLHGYDCHGQYDPADGLDYRYVAKGYDGRYAGSRREQEVLREEGLAKGRLTLRDEDVRFWRAVYDEKVARADARFAHFLAEFDRLGLTDRTLFIITSDHGTELYEHRRFDHGFTLYEEQLRVPLFVRVPGQQEGRDVAERVGSIDLMPTVLDLVGARLPADVREQMRGTSLAPVMAGEPSRHEVFAETDYRE
jgi:choline-sulfatase